MEHCRLCSLHIPSPPSIPHAITPLQSLLFTGGNLSFCPASPLCLAPTPGGSTQQKHRHPGDSCPASRCRASARSMRRRPQQCSAARRIHTNKHNQKPALTEQQAPPDIHENGDKGYKANMCGEPQVLISSCLSFCSPQLSPIKSRRAPAVLSRPGPDQGCGVQNVSVVLQKRSPHSDNSDSQQSLSCAKLRPLSISIRRENKHGVKAPDANINRSNSPGSSACFHMACPKYREALDK